MSTKQVVGIGDLARESGVKVVTIRYYEQIGLMPRPRRTRANYRCYGKDARERLQFIRRCRSFGFTLNQVRELLRLSSEKAQSCEEIRRIAAEHRKNVEEKIRELRCLSQELQLIYERCHDGLTIADCPILEALSAPAAPGLPETAPYCNSELA